uniref:KAT8 regulatory NSL complex subunit 2 n=1 Tax=Daphnia galeata TaxID=27404 RepID=A0A8J2WLJ3_9CRUS|nr:unnamed protein product [Daphnia galeata]
MMAMYGNQGPSSSQYYNPSQQTCHNTLYNCSQSCVEGFSYCLDHISEDRNAPYRSCTFVFANGKRCATNVLKGERRDGLCQDHAKRSALCKMKTLRKRQPPESLETLIDDLQHYSEAGNDEKATGTLSLIEKLSLNASTQKLQDYASESDSEDELPTAEQTVRQEDDSDAESIDSDQDDPLRHAGVFTPEEVVLLTRDKLIKLQALYLDQFKRLHHQLKCARRRYLNGVKREKENGVASAPYPDTPSERRAVAKLRSLRRFQRHRGSEALLHHQLQEKRLQVTQGVNYKAPPTPKCSFVDCGIKCTNPAVPLTKHCTRHVLNDSSQMLFRPCGAIFHDNECKEPVINFSENTRCVFHTMMPPMILEQDICVPSPLISVDDEIEKVDIKIEVDDVGQTCG